MNSKTKLYSRLKSEARSLRREGRTFSEIQSKVGDVPKGTLSGWLRDIELSDVQLQRIYNIKLKAGLVGRQKGALANRQRRLDRIAAIRRVAAEEYGLYSKDSIFLAGLLLYLAEGTKKSEAFVFMNSDIKLTQFMMDWVEKFSNIPRSSIKFRLYIHELYAHENCEQFWREGLGVGEEQFLGTIYKPTGREYKKNPNYKGCLRMELPGSELYWKTMSWRDCFYGDLR